MDNYPQSLALGGGGQNLVNVLTALKDFQLETVEGSHEISACGVSCSSSCSFCGVCGACGGCASS
jgi:hypothetical protein